MTTDQSFRLTKMAVEDLRGIGRYTQEQWGLEQRNIYLARLDDAFHTIARQPLIGKSCDYIRKGYRKYHADRHLIFYICTTTHIEIIRVLHDRMDVESKL